MTNWLQDQPVPRINTAQLRAMLSQLEATYKQTREARQKADQQFGTSPSPVRDAQRRLIADAAKAQLADLTAQIRQQFAALRVQADAQRADARRQFVTSADGRLYRETLQSLAAIAGRLTPDQLADRLNDAVAAGLVGEAKAIAELARLDHAVPTGNLFVALELADTHARTPAEAEAASQYGMIDAADRRFGLFARHQTDSGLTRALEDQSDPAEGSFADSNIFIDGGEGAE